MLDHSEIILRLLVAAALGAVVGLERERLDWAAGLRTHMLVCLGSCLVMIVSIYGFADALTTDHVVLDPSRVAAQVISGIGFLGAGTILFLRQKVIRGLTTAASLWTIAAVGLAVGGGLYLAAVVAVGIALIILVAVKAFELRVFPNRRWRRLTVVARAGRVQLASLREVLDRSGVRIMELTIASVDDDRERFVLSCAATSGRDGMTAAVDSIRTIDGVEKVSA
jgi:putative Mg2+ transporter-C (MgtC) family protein